MISGIKYVSNEQGEVTAVLLDLAIFQKEGTKAEEVITELHDLQMLIDKAPMTGKGKNWKDVRTELLKSNISDKESQ